MKLKKWNYRIKKWKGETMIINKIKEMEYKQKNIEDILATGEYLGVYFYVKTLGTHPCCYLSISNKIYNDEKLIYEKIDVHGGITYKSRSLRLTENITIYGYFIGWDYAHCNDFMGYYEEYEKLNFKKYSVDEIIEECKSVIEQIAGYKLRSDN